MEALACYNWGLRLNGQLVRGWNNKGNLLIRLGRAEDAIWCFEQALTINPGFAMAWNGKGAALASLGKPHEALPCFERALQLGHIEAKQNIALCRQQLSRKPRWWPS